MQGLQTPSDDAQRTRTFRWGVSALLMLQAVAVVAMFALGYYSCSVFQRLERDEQRIHDLQQHDLRQLDADADALLERIESLK